jgi:trk system potassium uptake protein TrkA
MGRVRNWLQPTGRDGTESVIVVGLGRFGTAVARTLVDLDIEVLGLDINRTLVNRWADELTACRELDATDPAALQEIGVERFDVAVVAIGDNIEASILATAALVDLGVGVVWTKAITAEHGRILERIGAHHVVFPEHEMGRRVAHVVSGHVVDYFQLDEDFVIAEVTAPDWAIDRTLADSSIRSSHGVTVVCVRHQGGHFTNAEAGTMIADGDLLVVAGQKEQIRAFAEDAGGS